MSDPDSNDGRYLLLRTEFNGQIENRTSLVIARRTKDGPDVPQSKLLMSMLSRTGANSNYSFALICRLS